MDADVKSLYVILHILSDEGLLCQRFDEHMQNKKEMIEILTFDDTDDILCYPHLRMDGKCSFFQMTRNLSGTRIVRS